MEMIQSFIRKHIQNIIAKIVQKVQNSVVIIGYIHF